MQEIKDLLFKENSAYLALWAMLSAKELFNATVLNFVIKVDIFVDTLGAIFGSYFILVIASQLCVILNILGDNDYFLSQADWNVLTLYF